MTNPRRTPSPRLSPHLKLSLLHAVQRRMAALRGKPPTGEDGVSIILVLIVTLILIIGTATLASRGFQGLIGSVFLGQRREASAAAELGASWFISQMNREGNRALLVNGTDDNQGLQAPGTAFSSGNIGENLCKLASTSGTTPLIDPPNTGSNKLFSSSGNYTWYITDTGELTEVEPTGNYRSFELLGVGQPSYRNLSLNDDRNFADLSASGTQPLYLQVEGSSYRDGERVASITLEKEFEVVPKCCGRSFGDPHGNDDYSEILGSEINVCVPDTIDIQSFGILANVGGNGGGYSFKGASLSVETLDGQTVEPLLCLNGEGIGNECSNQFNPSRDSLTVNTELPPPPSFCGATGCGTPPTPLSLSGMATAASALPAADRLIDESSEDFKFYATSADLDNLPSNCDSTTATIKGEEVTTIHCNMENLGKDFDSITAYTSEARRLAFYFPNPSGDSIFEIRGNRPFINKACSNGTLAADVGGCENLPSTSFDDYPINTISILGCTECSSQTIEMKGTPESLYMFIHAPNATLEFKGDSTFTGIAWVKNVNGNGNVEFVVPGSGLGDIINNKDSPFFDWSARSTNRFRWIGN